MKLKVFYKDLLAGTLERTARPDIEDYIFQYDSAYLAAPVSRPISVNLPLQAEPFNSPKLFPFFDNLLAEGWLLDLQTAAFKIDKKDRFKLISICGLECTGAVSLRGYDE